MPHGLIFELGLLSRMRPEEYLALQWSDLDFEEWRGTEWLVKNLFEINNGRKIAVRTNLM